MMTEFKQKYTTNIMLKRDVCGNVLCLWIPQCRCVRSLKICPMKEVYLFTWLDFTVSFVKVAMASSEVCRCAHCSCCGFPLRTLLHNRQLCTTGPGLQWDVNIDMLLKRKQLSFFYRQMSKLCILKHAICCMHACIFYLLEKPS